MLLTTLIVLPLIFAVMILFSPKRFVHLISLTLSLAELFVSFEILTQFDKNSSALQLVERYPWISSFGINYFVGIDGISIWLVFLTVVLVPITILASLHSIQSHVKSFHVNIFLLQSFMLGTFLSLDAILFYVFFEAALIPMYLMIGIWGGPRRIYATMKFFIFTMAGSVLMLASIITLMFMARDQFGSMTSDLLALYKLNIPFVSGSFFNPQNLMFFAFAIAFAIKVPMFPFHTWLPDAHVEAPTPGSVILAAVMLKMGTYGFLRMVFPLFPEASQHWAMLFMILGVIGIVYGALVAMVQPDIKKLVAYSSVSHMGYVMVGLFAMNYYGITGALYQMLNHGVSTGALFLLVGIIYERTHHREIEKYGGLAAAMPIYTILFFIVTLSSIAVPGTNGFVGEFLILMGTFLKQKVIGAISVLGVVLGAAYMLWMFKKVFFGKPGELVKGEDEDNYNIALKDVNAREFVVLLPLLVLIFWMGLFPNQFLSWSKASIDNYVENKGNYTLQVLPHDNHPSMGAAPDGHPGRQAKMGSVEGNK